MMESTSTKAILLSTAVFVAAGAVFSSIFELLLSHEVTVKAVIAAMVTMQKMFFFFIFEIYKFRYKLCGFGIYYR